MALGDHCRSGCRTKDHESWGACARAARLRTIYCASAKGAGGDLTAQKRWDKDLSNYRDARAQGIQPAGTTAAAVEKAVRWSDSHGRAFNADSVDAVTP